MDQDLVSEVRPSAGCCTDLSCSTKLHLISLSGSIRAHSSNSFSIESPPYTHSGESQLILIASPEQHKKKCIYFRPGDTLLNTFIYICGANRSVWSRCFDRGLSLSCWMLITARSPANAHGG
jgi:hypothetical protein